MIEPTIINDIDDQEPKLWERVLVTNEDAPADPYDGATVMVHTVETPLHVALDELAQLEAGIARMQESADMLRSAVTQYTIENGEAVAHERLDIKMRKGREETDHEGAVMSHLSDGYATWDEVSTICQKFAKIPWAKVSKHLQVPKSTLGRFTQKPGEPTVSIKLKEI